MTAQDHSGTDSRPGSHPAAPNTDLRPGDVDLSDPKTLLKGVPHQYFRVLRGWPSTIASLFTSRQLFEFQTNHEEIQAAWVFDSMKQK